MKRKSELRGILFTGALTNRGKRISNINSSNRSIHKIAAEAGLFSDENIFTKFPNSDIVTVSVNLLNGK
jgi:hypothetical protein